MQSQHEASSKLRVGDCELVLGPQGDDDFAPIFSTEWLGTEVWPAARALVSLLETSCELRPQLQDAVVVELGAGTGAVGMAAAALGACEVILTDLDSLVPAMEANIARNIRVLPQTCQALSCEALHWSCDEAMASELSIKLAPCIRRHIQLIVLMADCLNSVYGDTHAEALACTLHAVFRCVDAAATDGPAPLALMSQTLRGEAEAEASFFEKCGELGLANTLLRTVDPSGSLLCDMCAGAAQDQGSVCIHAIRPV